VNGAVSGIFAATGQTCIAGSRLLVQDSIYDELVQKLVTLSKTAKMGDPMSSDTQIGPVTTRPQYEKILSYIDIAKNEGAKLLMGGEVATRPECGNGWFIEPTIFGDVNNQMRIAREEVFGPILSVIRFKDEADAIKIANDTRFGLAAAVWTQNIHRAHRVAHQLRAGTVWINAYRVVSFLTPFGGFKESGMGRENGIDSIREYTETKSVYVELTGEPRDPFTLG
jgi:aldehyde dehydrogenase (NAD+)